MFIKIAINAVIVMLLLLLDSMSVLLCSLDLS